MALNRNGSPEGSISKKIVTTKGDLITATANAIPSRLAAGSDGDTLVADSAATVGLRYSAIPSASNPIINSAFDIWQRGTSSTTTGGYAADRWYAANNANSTYSRQTTGDTTNLPSIQFCARLARNSGATSTDGTNFIYNFESTDSIPFAGKTVTLSFYARKGANLSSDFNVYLHTGTGTDQNYWTGFTGSATPINSGNIASTLTTSWVRYSYTGTVASTATQLAIQIFKANAGTAGAADYVEVTGVMVNIGSVALPYRRNSGTLQGELAAAMRYYYKVTNPFAVSVNQSATQTSFVLPYPVEMRVAPTATYSAASTFYIASNSSGGATAVATNTAKTFQLAVNLTTSGQTAFNAGFISNNGTSTIEVSAEL